MKSKPSEVTDCNAPKGVKGRHCLMWFLYKFCHVTVPPISYGDGSMSHGVSLLDFNYQGESGCVTPVGFCLALTTRSTIALGGLV